MSVSLDGLSAAVLAIGTASEAASSSLSSAGYVTDDMPIIQEQAVRARGTVDSLKRILAGEGERDEVFVLLHQINNQLTGILSLTLLVKDDLIPEHLARSPLDALDRAARNAAAVVKDVAAQLRSGA